jgi:hypothetical protein
MDASSVSLDASADDLNATAGISLNQSDDDLNLSDFDLDHSNSAKKCSNDLFSNTSPMPTEEFCPYCENIYVESFKEHVKTCATAQKFEEAADLGNDDKFLESDTSDAEMSNELDLSPNPGTSVASSSSPFEPHAEVPRADPPPSQITSAAAPHVDVHRADTYPPLQCPICLSDFPQSSPEELEAHAGSCQDFYSPPDDRTCFMCDQEFSSSVPEIEFQRHVEDHFKEKDLQEHYKDPEVFGTENEKKRKLDSLALLKTSPSKLAKQFQGSNQIHSRGKFPQVRKSPESSKSLVKDNSSEIKQFPESSQTHDNCHSSQIKQSPISNQSQLRNTVAQMKQSPGLSQPKVKKEEFPQIKHPSGPSQTEAKFNVYHIKTEHKNPPTSSPNVDSHIQSLISRFDESCSQTAVQQIFVAAHMVGLIIGEKAWFKKKVLEDTGVNISVESRNSQVSGPVAVTLIGPSVNLPKAVAMIQLKLGPRLGLMQKS